MESGDLEWAVFVGGELDGYSVSDRGDVVDPKGRWMSGSVYYNRQMMPYLRVKIRGVRYLIHRLVLMGFTDTIGEIVDHINGCTLDNRLCNLRWATNRQNQWNATWKTSMEGFKNIGYDKHSEMWKVRLVVGQGKQRCRFFSNMYDALVWRDETMRQVSDGFYRAN